MLLAWSSRTLLFLRKQTTMLLWFRIGFLLIKIYRRRPYSRRIEVSKRSSGCLGMWCPMQSSLGLTTSTISSSFISLWIRRRHSPTPIGAQLYAKPNGSSPEMPSFSMSEWWEYIRKSLFMEPVRKGWTSKEAYRGYATSWCLNLIILAAWKVKP
jgi:hypothetical protein